MDGCAEDTAGARGSGRPVDGTLGSSVTEQYDPGRPNLLDRWNGHQGWWDARLAAGVDPYCKTTLGKIGPAGTTRMRGGAVHAGVNFASQDYLSLAGHPAIAEAAKRAIDRFGVHSAGSPALMGNSALSVQLERRLAGFLGYDDCTVFATGWAAGYGVIKTLVQPDDYIVIDRLAHASLQEGARSATRNVFSVPHLSNAATAGRLERLRRDRPDAGILVVSETVFSMDSDVPDIAGLVDICDRLGATLLVDAAHDIGAIGPTGRGFLERQGMTGRPDVLMGSFSKTFASNGGFVACNHPALKMALRSSCGPLTFSNALSPVQAAIVLRAMDIIEAEEGNRRRTRLLKNATRLRAGLQSAGFDLLGEPSAIVPAVLGATALSRLATRYALEAGALVNLVEHPAVSMNTCRWRLQVMADHNDQQVDDMVRIAALARQKAASHLQQLDDGPIAGCSSEGCAHAAS
jgi:glycine C-acetyltransferase